MLRVRDYQSEAAAARDQAAAVTRERGGQVTLSDIFDRDLVRAHRDRAALQLNPNDPLQLPATERLVDRIDDCLRKFPTALVVGGAAFHTIDGLRRSRADVQEVTYVDASSDMLHSVKRLIDSRAAAGGSGSRGWPTVRYVQADEELLPVQPGSVDLVVSSLAMHWINDLPGVLTQCRLALKPDGLFLGAMFGGDTLQELRIALTLAQQEQEGGISPYVSPLAQVRDAGNLLTRAGLALPVVDSDTFVMRYSSPYQLLQHLRALGESNALRARKGRLARATAAAAQAQYAAMFGLEDGTVPATFQVIYMTGWAPAPSQPKPAARGSANVSFQDIALEMEKRGAVVGSAEGEQPQQQQQQEEQQQPNSGGSNTRDGSANGKRQ